MPTLLWILLSTLLVSLISLIGAFTLTLSNRLLKKILLALVGLAAGTLIGGAFLHLIPEALHELEGAFGHEANVDNVMLMIIVGFVIFFALEKWLWRHCHDKDCKIHTFAYMNLAGDAVHNFMDGLIMATGFLAGIEIGIAATLAVAFHEIPQEIGDFGVLIHGGLSKKKALFYNFLTALTAIAGGLLGFFIIPEIGEIQIYILPVAAGGFIYIAAADLVPELHKEHRRNRVALAFSTFLIGIFIMWLLKVLAHGAH